MDENLPLGDQTPVDFTPGDQRTILPMPDFNRIFNRDDVVRSRSVKFMQNAAQSGGFARSGWPCDQDQSAGTMGGSPDAVDGVGVKSQLVKERDGFTQSTNHQGDAIGVQKT